MSTHRKIDREKIERAVRRSAALLAPGVVLGTGAALAVDQAPASAASVTTWDRVAACESSNNWSDTTGIYEGGLQFAPSTWEAYGGHVYAPHAYQATKAQQIAVAEKVLKSQGPGAWPVCSVKAGLTAGGPAPQFNTVQRAARPRAVVRTAPVTTQASMAAAYALAKIGSPYIYGATGPHSFDCSGLVYAAWRSAGVRVPRTSGAQWSGLTHVSTPHVGDVIVYSGAGHVALYVGNGKIVEAPRPGLSVRTAPWRSGWYATHFVGIVRPLSHTVTTQGEAAPSAKTSTHKSRTPVPVSHYTVQRGDWLSKISKRYDLAGGWERLYALNRGVVGSDPDLIFPGQVLRLH